MIKSRLQLVTAKDAAHWFKVPYSTIRRWAVEDQWHPYGTPKLRKWNFMEIQATYDSRARKRSLTGPT